VQHGFAGFVGASFDKFFGSAVMNILVTAGNTLTPIDKVRCITNIFTGRTGAGIALHAAKRGHSVTLLTSHPEALDELDDQANGSAKRLDVRRYRLFADLQTALADLVRRPGLDAIIHAAAVSDYQAAGIFAPGAATSFRPETATWETATAKPPALIDVSAGKVKSDAPELWLRLERTPKLVDLFRRDWGFRGLLVKFKLEAGISEERLLEIAEKSRVQSAADLMVANTLEGASAWAYLGPVAGRYERVGRRDLADRLLREVERLHEERSHG
jgi:phosphopantothenoylcysteine synthetase/decarboxylase